MRSRLPLIAVAIALAAVLTFVIFQNLESYKGQLRQQFAAMSQGMELVSVVVMAADVNKRGTVLTQDMLRVEDVPAKALQPYAIQDPLDAIGKEPIGPLAQGQQVLRNQLIVPGTGGGTLASKIPPEKRAISIEVDLLSSVSGFVRPNDAVDILWTFQVQGQPVTLTLFQNVQLLAVGGMLRSTNADAETQAEPRTVTLAMAPQEAELLLFARQLGPIQLSLRPRSDTNVVALPHVTLDLLLQQVLQQPKPEPPPPPMKTKRIEVIRGTNREQLMLAPDGGIVSTADMQQAVDAAVGAATAAMSPDAATGAPTLTQSPPANATPPPAR